MRRAVVAISATVLLAGCGPASVVTKADPVASPYAGPMSLPIHNNDAASV